MTMHRLKIGIIGLAAILLFLALAAPAPEGLFTAAPGLAAEPGG